jgi:Mu transposase, C-terminal domain
MANVLNEDKKQQVIALGRLGWSLRRIEQATGVRRETASAYLKAAGVSVRPSGGWGRQLAPSTAQGVACDTHPSKPANEVTPDPGRPKPAGTTPLAPAPTAPVPQAGPSLEPFRYYQYGQRTVHLDGCVEVEAAYYSAPPGWIGRAVHVQWDALCVRLLDPQTGQLLREHLRQKRGRFRIHKEDFPKRTPLSTTQLLARAARAGAHIGVLCRAIHDENGEPGVRRILGVLSLAKKFGPAAVEDACAAALELGVHEYRFVRRYLERRPQAPLSLQQVDPLIRELVHYRDLIQQRLDNLEPSSPPTLFETTPEVSG